MLWILLTFKEKKEKEQQDLSQTYNKKEPKDSTIEKEVNDAGKDC